MSIELTSTEFKPEDTIPKQLTGDGSDKPLANKVREVLDNVK